MNDAHDSWEWSEGLIKLLDGTPFNVLQPDPTKIKVIDIAHNLGMLVRYNGAIPYFYSVGEHSVVAMRCAQQAGVTDRTILKAVLLHDAEEAYTGDLIRPLKKSHSLKGRWEAIAIPVQNAIEDRFDLPAGILGMPEIGNWDRAAFEWEQVWIRNGAMMGMYPDEARRAFNVAATELGVV